MGTGAPPPPFNPLSSVMEKNVRPPPLYNGGQRGDVCPPLELV